MTLVSTAPATRLAHRRMLRLRDHDGDRVECLDGSVWITQDGDPRDVVLDAGEGFTLDRPGTAIVYALADARVVVQRPTAASVQRSDSESVRRALRGLAAAPRRAA
jgi:Protein of unknown function (DUF2917)